MYSAKRTVTKSSSSIPTRVHSRTSLHSNGNKIGGVETVVAASETASANSKDSGFTRTEVISEGNEAYLNSRRESSIASSRSFTTTELRLELDEDVAENDDFLKEELIHIFERERSTLELYFKNKIEDLLHKFRKGQHEWEEASRAEKADMENTFAQEKTAMQRSFGEEIAKLTRTFNEERAQLEEYYKAQLQEMKDQARREQADMEERTAREKIELREKLEAEYQVMLKSEVDKTTKGARQEKEELERRLGQEKGDLEREHKLRMTNEEARAQQMTAEMESKFQRERLDLEQDFRQKLTRMEETLHQERELRCAMERELEQERELRYETERQLEHEKLRSSSLESSWKEEGERLKSEIAELRRELDEKNRSVSMEMRMPEGRILQSGGESSSGTRGQSWERPPVGQRTEFDVKYQEGKGTQAQSEDRRFQEEMHADTRKERQWSKDSGHWPGKKDDKSGTGSAVCGQAKRSSDTGDPSRESGFYYVSPESENALRIEINNLRSENDGLKAKVTALEENIELHKKYKTEVQAEMERLQKSQTAQSHDNDHMFRLKLEKEVRDAQSKSREYERTLKELRQQLKEKQRAEADRSTRDVEAKVRELEKRIRALEEMAGEADAKAKRAEEQLKEARQQIREVSTMHAKGEKQFGEARVDLEQKSHPAEDYPDRVSRISQG